MTSAAPGPPAGAGVLDRIAARTRRDVAERAARTPRRELEARVHGEPRDFRGALAAGDLGLIAEFKPRSPSRGDLRPDAVPEEIAAAYRPYAAAISVLCDQPFFGGSREALGRIRATSGLPVLCKDFLLTPYQVVEARAAGADAVLLIVALLPDPALRELLGLAGELGMGALVEVHDEVERERALAAGADIVGINSRDLRTLDVDLSRIEVLAPGLPTGVLRVGESGMHDRAGVERLRPLLDAVLIGTALMTSSDPAARIESLGFLPCR